MEAEEQSVNPSILSVQTFSENEREVSWPWGLQPGSFQQISEMTLSSIWAENQGVAFSFLYNSGACFDWISQINTRHVRL